MAVAGRQARPRRGALPLRRAGVATLLALLSAVGVTPVTPSHAQNPGEPSGPVPSPVTEPEVILDGKGWGHGVGMTQDGAYAMGAAGASAEEILAAFYPG